MDSSEPDPRARHNGIRTTLTGLPDLAASGGVMPDGSSLPPPEAGGPDPVSPPDEHPSASDPSGEVEFRHPDGVVRCPQLIGDYKVLALVGRGGMGSVFRARNQFFEHDEALKVLHDWFDSTEARKRFLREMRTQASLEHPNIARVHYAGRYRARGKGRDHLYFVMSLEAGDFGGKGPLPPRQAAEVVRQVARAIAHAHAKKVIHCDLKPKNILLGRDDKPKVTDFGLVRLLAQPAAGRTGPDARFGTPAYMPPEQAGGDLANVTERSDVYGLGAVLYELLTGRPPYEAPADKSRTIFDDIQDPAVKPIPPRQVKPAVPPRLEAIALKCLEKDPAERYQTATAVAEALDRVLRPPAWKRHWPAAVILVLFAVLTWLLVATRPTPRADAAVSVAAGDKARDEDRPDDALRSYADAEKTYQGILNDRVVFDRGWVQEQLAGLKGRQDAANDLKRQQRVLAARSLVTDASQALNKGDRRRAFDLLGEAVKEFEKLVQDKSVPDPALRRDAALALTRRAELHVEDRDWVAAARDLDAAGRVLQTNDPGGHPDAVLAQAEVEHIWGVYHQDQDEVLEARDRFQKGLSHRLPLLADRKTDLAFLRDLARSFGYLGDTQFVTGQVRQAELSYKQAEKHRADVAGKLREDAAAQCLHARDPGNFANLHEWIGGPDHERQADLKHRERLDLYLKYVAPLTDFLPGGHQPERANTRLNVAELWLDRPDDQLDPARRDEVRAWLTAARDELEALADVESREPGAAAPAALRPHLARLHVVWGRFHHRAGDSDAARSECRKAVGLYARLGDEGKARAVDYYNQAAAEALMAALLTTPAFDRLGHQVRALDLLGKAVRMKFRHLARLDRDHVFKPLAAGYPTEFKKVRADIVESREDLKRPVASGPAGGGRP